MPIGDIPGTREGMRIRVNKTGRLLLRFDTLAGIILFAVFLLPRSEPGRQLIFGLSAPRLAIGAVFLALLLLHSAAALSLAADPGTRLAGFERLLSGILTRYRSFLLVALYTLIILSGAFLALSIPPIIRPLAFLQPLSARLGTFMFWVFLTAAVYLVVIRITGGEAARNDPLMLRLNGLLALAGILLISFVLYAQIASLIGWINKTRYSYWNLLAAQFLEGKLYLEKPPYTHDLTLYNGKWFVPMPPLPAVLLMPLALIVDPQNISTSYFSMLFSALNGVLLFLILKEARARGWIKLSWNGILLLVALFLFGTPHLWVGISGRAWFVSQIVSVTFIALSVYGAFRCWSPWLIGILLGISVLSRPNGLLTWLFAFAIAMQLEKERGSVWQPKQMLGWALKTALPVLAAILLSLGYNHLRFGNALDFGYATLNGDPDIVRSVQAYGMFSPHFILTNLRVMFLRLPELHWTGPWPIEPSTTGMSIFVTTPALIYLFHRYPRQWWVVGAWASVILNIMLLSLYHNTGAHQFGYRYILDFLIPLMVLLAAVFKERVTWPFVLLVVVSIAYNIYGANWFMNA